MKLSLKLQDERHQNPPPVLRAKIPITIFNQRFTSSLTTTATSATPQDLSFSLSTNFSSGPSIRLTYTPVSTTTITTASPFSLSLKSGLGLFGSPHDSPLIFSAHFSLSPTNPSPVTPSFFLHFKPQFGNFSLHKTTSSSNPSPRISGSHSVSAAHLQSGSSSNSEFANGSVSTEASAWQDLKLEPCNASANDNGFVNFNPSFYNGVDSSNGIGFVKDKAMVWRDGKKGGFLTGISIKANTVLPVTKGVMVNLRWGVNFPADSEVKFPYLTVNKIGIERVEKVEEVEKKKKKKNVESKEGDLELLKGMCFWMKRDLEVLEKENRDMKQCLQEMRMGVSARSYRGGSDSSGKKVSPSSSESFGDFERWRGRKNGDGNGQTELKKSVTVSQADDLESQLQKAIKAASS
ncbi:hypothetical protein Dsin_030365 [Dipteronia sinensis]|uniref:Uncharacterized protein n=1 Tax=Dipteronia sinensis TaxID=43782 RepID=A0AAE0DR79_9ROSI|nr:hypothetical protein Dsin_030365 [Dipteronia sinensis]